MTKPHSGNGFANILRVHISKEVTLPLTLKYDLNDPNLFGIFSFQWNLEGGKKG